MVGESEVSLNPRQATSWKMWSSKECQRLSGLGYPAGALGSLRRMRVMRGVTFFFQGKRDVFQGGGCKQKHQQKLFAYIFALSFWWVCDQHHDKLTGHAMNTSFMVSLESRNGPYGILSLPKPPFRSIETGERPKISRGPSNPKEVPNFWMNPNWEVASSKLGYYPKRFLPDCTWHRMNSIDMFCFLSGWCLDFCRIPSFPKTFMYCLDLQFSKHPHVNWSSHIPRKLHSLWQAPAGRDPLQCCSAKIGPLHTAAKPMGF